MLEIIGKLKRITEIENVLTKSGNTFAKRNVILDCSRVDEWTGDVYTNILCFEIPPAKVNDYDKYKHLEGNVVKVRFALNGRENVNGMGESKFFITARCIELVPQQPVQQYTEQPVQQVQQQVQQPMQQQPMQQQPAQPAQPMQQQDFMTKQKADDLPF